MVKLNKFFVYGTLKVGGALAAQFDKYRENCVKAVLPNYAIYDLGWFPGILKETGEEVFGEIHTYEEDEFKHVLNMFDRIEGYSAHSPGNSLYLRKVVTVVNENNNKVSCNCYIFNNAHKRSMSEFTKVAGKTWDIAKR